MGASYLDAIRADAGQRCLARDELKATLRDAYGSPVRKLGMLIGPGGIGKSTLANWLASHVRASGGAVAWVSGEQIAPNPDAFINGLRITSGNDPAPDLSQIGRRDVRDLVVIDSLERLRPLLHWIVQDFLGLFGTSSLVLLAGRERLTIRDRTDLGINDVLVEWPVEALSADDAGEVVRALGVAEAHRARVIEAAHGFPLALRLLAERPDGIGAATGHGAAGLAPDVLAALVDAFVSRAPSPTHVHGIYLASIARRVDEAMLATVCEVDGASADSAGSVFDWLGRTSIVERTELGISAHALVRDVVFSHLLQRNPELLERLQGRLIDLLVTRMVSTDTTSAHELLLQAFYARRNSPIVKDQLHVSDELERCEVIAIGPHNVAEVRHQIERFEGPVSLASFDRWMTRKNTLGHAVVGADGKIRSFQVIIRVPRDAHDEDLSDPLIAKAWQLWRALEAPGATRDLHLFRWFIETETHQRFTAAMTSLQTLGAVITLPHDEVKAIGFVNTPPEQWAPYARNFQLVSLLDYVDFAGMRWGVSLGDPERMKALFATTGAPIRNAMRALVYTLMGFPMPVPMAVTAATAISRETFGQLLRRALNHLNEPQALRDPEMIGLVGETQGGLDQAVASLVQNSIKRLAASSGTARHAAILDVTYVRPTVKQHAAAMELGLPYGTYRYQLRKAVAVLEEELWHLRMRGGTTGS